MFKKTILCLLTLLTTSHSSCFSFKKINKELSKIEYNINNQISFILQSQEKIIRTLSQKEISKKEVININTINKYFDSLIKKPLENDLKKFNHLLMVTNKKNIRKTERQSIIKKHFKIEALLHNKFSSLISHQKLIIKMAYEHPSKMFKEVTETAYIGMPIIFHICFAYLTIYLLIYFSAILSEIIFYPHLFFIESFWVLFPLPIIATLWYYRQKNSLLFTYFQLFTRYQYDLDANQTLDEYNDNQL